KLTEMPRHAERGLCCGAGGARMWMEEHIGKRVNTERTEEAIDTGASAIATGCPFCRVMMTDGVDDVSATRDIEKVEVLDVAQLLLGSLDKSLFELPEKGTAAKESEERAARLEAETATAPAKTDEVEEAEPAAEAEDDAAEAKASTASETKPVTGLGVAGGAKKPGKKSAAAEPEAKPAEATTEAAPAKGLGIAGGAKRPGAKKTAAAPAEAPAAETAAAAPAKAEPEVKGLGIAGGAKRPGAKKAAPAAQASAPAAPAEAPAAETASAPEAAKPEPEVKGLGIASGARRPGAKKAAAAPAAKASPNEGEPTVVQPPNVDPDKAEAGTEAADTADSDRGLEPAKPEPEVKGLGIAAGARRPGAKKAAAAPKAAPVPEPEVKAEPAPEPEAAAEPEPHAKPESSSTGNGEARVVGDEPPVKGLGIAKGARRPGRK
ncbi:Fe-S oxidoreductase, partial [Mycobacterium sp. ITM-2017-0098]